MSESLKVYILVRLCLMQFFDFVINEPNGFLMKQLI